MKPSNVLATANITMLMSFLAFVFSALAAYGLEDTLPLMVITLLHVAQMFLAGAFKVAYVVRLVSQKQLGLAVS